jgi:hypothetical protein
MAHSTTGLKLYSNLTGNKIGQAVCIHVPVANETATYYEYEYPVQFRLDVTNQIVIRTVRWRKPKDGYCYHQFSGIENNNTGLVTVNFTHIMKGVYPQIDAQRNYTHRMRIGGSIAAGQLQPAGGILNVAATKKSNGTYTITITGTGNRIATHDVTPDMMTPENANELDFETGF